MGTPKEIGASRTDVAMALIDIALLFVVAALSTVNIVLAIPGVALAIVIDRRIRVWLTGREARRSRL